MFGLFEKKTGGNNTATGINNASPEYKTAPGTSIHFDPELVAQLKDDHKALIGLYMEIKSLFEAENYKAVSKNLGDFRTALQGHLLTENVRLYIYLDHMFQMDEINSELIRGFRKDMDGIAKVAINFLKKYEEIGVDQDLAIRFADDFSTIGEVLTKRIEKEETILYPLYTATS